MSLFQKKKALVLFGSPQSHGHTARLLESFLECFRHHDGWEVEVADLYRLNPHPCTGCKACAKEERCAYPDLDALDKSLRACDLLVVASPVYNFSFPAPVKAWLVLTMGSQDEFAVKVCTHQLERAFSVMNTTLSAWAVWDATDRGGERKAGAQAAARAIALEILGKM